MMKKSEVFPRGEKQFQRQIDSKYKYSKIDQSLLDEPMHDTLSANTTTHFRKLTKKVEKTEEMKAVSRGFHQSLYKKLTNRISQKPLSFFIFGLKDSEKKSCQRVFNEIFDVPRKKMNGTLSVTDLWSNATSIKYLKENKMFCNKQVILKQFKEIAKQVEENKKLVKKEKEKDQIQQYKRLMENNKENQNNDDNDFDMKKEVFKSKQAFEPHKACRKIKEDLKFLGGNNSLHLERRRSNSRRLIKRMESDSNALQDIESRFKKNMIVLF